MIYDYVHDLPALRDQLSTLGSIKYTHHFSIDEVDCRGVIWKGSLVKNEYSCGVSVRAGRQSFKILFTDWPLLYLASVQIAPEALIAFPQEIRVAIVQRALSHILSQVHQDSGAQCEIEEVFSSLEGLSFDVHEEAVLFELHENDPETLWAKGAIVGDVVQGEAFSVWIRSLSMELKDYAKDLKLLISLQVAASDLDKEDYLSLAVGDVVLIDDGASLSESIGLVRIFGRPVWTAHISDAGFEVLEFYDLHQDADSHSKSIRLVFEAAAQTFLYSDLIKVEEGYLFAHLFALKSPVRIVVNGEGIGSGEMIEFADRFGVKILKIEPTFRK
jgi:hypothetical protein